MGKASGGKYTNYGLEATQLLMDDSGFEVNCKAGKQRIMLEVQELFGSGQTATINALREENKILKQNLVSF